MYIHIKSPLTKSEFFLARYCNKYEPLQVSLDNDTLKAFLTRMSGTTAIQDQLQILDQRCSPF